MGNPFAKLKTEGLEENTDSLGGGNYSVKETDIYTGEVKLFYAGESATGAQSVTIVLSGGDFGETEYRETVYVTGGKDKGQLNYYMVKDKDQKETGQKRALPGFTVADDMAMATVGKELNELDFEEKVVNLYDYDAKKEMPKTVMMATEMLGATVSVAILKTTENATEKVGNEYKAKADGSTRDVNSIEKVFHTESKMTLTEARAAQEDPSTEAKFWDAWVEKNKGKTRNRVKEVGGKSGKPGGNAGGAPTGSGNANAAAPRTSLFGKK